MASRQILANRARVLTLEAKARVIAMASSGAVLLQDRGVLAVSGADARSFLQGLLTNDVEALAEGRAIFAALLTPQGKILFDVLLYDQGSGYLLDCPAHVLPDLAKRLGFYKLRAKAGIEDVSSAWQVAAAWGDMSLPETALGYPDPRLPALGLRGFVPASNGLDSADDYEAHRIALCVPEGGRDYAYGAVFPHDACLDLLNGVSFRKGCFVGQEVVSRMQHRGTARTRVLAVESAEPLHAGADITADGYSIGKLGTVAGRRGIALARIDRAAAAIARGETVLAGAAPVRLSVPQWANYSLDPAPAGAEA